ncbi:MAG: M3 family metallopeptidase, partial [Candidatus Babeliales bacterium]
MVCDLSKMVRFCVSIIIIVGICGLLSFVIYSRIKGQPTSMKPYATITSIQDLVNLFPQQPQDIKQRTQKSIDAAKAALDQLIAIPDDQRTYENTARVFDVVCTLSDGSIVRNVLSVLEMVSPDKAIRGACHEAVEQMNNFSVDALENNEKLYKALKSYAARSVDDATLTTEQRYFIEKTVEDYERNGLNLPLAERDVVGKLKKELAKLEQDFEVNIATDNRTITVDAAELKGCSQDFIKSLRTTEDGHYVLGVDYPTYHMIMEHCSVTATRKRLYDEYVNRGYPKNHEILQTVIAKRDQLAHILGFNSYAEFDLADQMVETPERAEQFLHDLYARASKK